MTTAVQKTKNSIALLGGDLEAVTPGAGATLVAGAGGGKPFEVFTALDNHPLASNFATLDTRNNHPILDFDDAATESSVFGSVLSSNYGGGGLTVEIYWMATTAIIGDVVWNASIERHQVGTTDLDADSFAAANAATSTTSGTSGVLTKTTITFTDGADMDSLAAGESFRIKIERIGGDASDTMVGDAELHRVVVRET